MRGSLPRRGGPLALLARSRFKPRVALQDPPHPGPFPEGEGKEASPGTARAITEDARRQALGLSRMGQPDEAAAIAFLLSPDAAYINRQCLHVDGGITR